MSRENYKYDINKLKNYKVLDSHFESPVIKGFVDCVLKSESKKDVINCGNYYHYDELEKDLEYFSVQSAGDSRCSGKSEILNLMFPSLMEGIRYGTEEEADKPRDIVLESETYSIHGDYYPPDEDTLAIYVQRDADEKLNCLIGRADEDTDTPFALPNEVEDCHEASQSNREINLPQLHEQKNYLLIENTNVEDFRITNETTCNTANARIDEAINNMGRSLSIDEKIVGLGTYKKAHKKHFENSVSSTHDDIEPTKEYADMCNLNNKYRELESIIDKRRKIAEEHT